MATAEQAIVTLNNGVEISDRAACAAGPIRSS